MLRLDLPGGRSEEVTVGTRRRVGLKVALREGRNDVGLVNLGPAASPVGRLDERRVSVQVSPWTVTRSR
jgi:hypothetical protein